MKGKIDSKILANFSKGNYSYNDYLKVKDWFQNVYNDKDTENFLFDGWQQLSDVKSQEDLQPVFEKIHYQILLEEKKEKRKLKLWQYYRNVAAVLIPLFIVTFFSYLLFNKDPLATDQWVEINVPEGAKSKFMLPDSTYGWLNSGAKLKYSPKFLDNRVVELEGEAFFDVKHFNNSKFIVSTRDMDVKVLGTQFNVSAYLNDPYTSVTLEKGKVEVIGKSAKFKKDLVPGDIISYNHNRKSLNFDKVDTKIYTSWKEGYLVINNEPLGQAALKIERWYNAELIIEDETLKNFVFKATFNDEPLEEVMRLIAMTTPIDYQIEKRDVDGQGILKKKKVIIKLK
ncbi:FecR family protein [Sunxiuqinia sp. A32]|uniref:FecR family protein n=1 Tax=Sunxiuqinia sp. A32 TaxID=3461496 RepID=UPI0040462757